MSTRSYELVVNKRRNGVRVAEIDEQFSAISLREAGKSVLKDWSLKDTEKLIIQGLASINGVNYADQNPLAVHTMLRHPSSVWGLSDAGAHVSCIIDAGVHTYMVTRWSRDTPADDPLHIPLETVVHKLTKCNADLFGFSDRGQLAPGMRADINLFELARLHAHAPRTTYDLPANMPRLSQQVEGYVATLVRGELVLEHGTLTGARPGRVLRGGASRRSAASAAYR